MNEYIEPDLHLEDGKNTSKVAPPEGWLPQGSRWLPRQGAKSDPGMEAKSGASTASFNRAVPADRTPETKHDDVDKDKEWNNKHETFSPIPGSLKEKANAKRVSPVKIKYMNVDAETSTTPTPTLPLALCS